MNLFQNSKAKAVSKSVTHPHATLPAFLNGPSIPPTYPCLQTRLTFLGYLPELKGNFEGLSYCEGDSLGLKNRKWGQGRGAVLGR